MRLGGETPDENAEADAVVNTHVTSDLDLRTGPREETILTGLPALHAVQLQAVARATLHTHVEVSAMSLVTVEESTTARRDAGRPAFEFADQETRSLAASCHVVLYDGTRTEDLKSAGRSRIHPEVVPVVSPGEHRVHGEVLADSRARR